MYQHNLDFQRDLIYFLDNVKYVVYVWKHAMKKYGVVQRLSHPNRFQHIPDPVQAHFGPISDPFRTHFGPISDPFRTHFGPISDPFQPISAHSETTSQYDVLIGNRNKMHIIKGIPSLHGFTNDLICHPYSCI